MNSDYETFASKITTIEGLRHYIDMEFSWLGAMVWVILGLSLYVHIGWWSLLVLYPVYKNLKLSIVLFLKVWKCVETDKKSCDVHFLDEINK